MMIKSKCLRNSPLAHQGKTNRIHITKILVPISAQNFLCLTFKDNIREDLI